jgi:hypothetical protein
MTIDVFERYAALDPAKAEGVQPEWGTTGTARLSTEIGRDPNMQKQHDTPTQPPEPKRSQTGLLVAAGAFAIVLIVGAVALLANSKESDPLAMGSTVEPPEALAMSDAYFDRYNEGDAEGVMGLFTPDATFSDSILRATPRADFEEILVWNTAQGTKLTSEGCTTTQTEDFVRVICDGATHDAPTQAVNGNPVPTLITLIVAPGGISQHTYTYGTPDFYHVGTPFEDWMLANNPDDAARVEFGVWSNLSEAGEFGLLVANNSKKWADYLESNDCTYLDGC